MAHPITLRPYQPGDGPLLAAFFYETVHTVNARDYTPAQLQAWAPSPEAPDPEAWDRSFQGRRALVAEAGGQKPATWTGCTSTKTARAKVWPAPCAPPWKPPPGRTGSTPMPP